MKRVIATVSVLGLSIVSLFAADPAKPAAGTPPPKSAEVAPKNETKPAVSAADKALLAHAAKESAKLTAPQKAKLLDILNNGDDKAVQDIPGVGEVKAANIKKARPLAAVDNLILVDGIGKVTFDGIVKWAAADFKAEPAKKVETPVPATPKKK